MKGKRVFVGLSGGVDSAVSAALLQKEGAHVTGVFIKGWYPPGMPCTWSDDRRDAMRVAARLGIPFITLDAGAEYKRGVIDYLLREYEAGRTPNPDVMCNREVKFGAFYDFARAQGADFIATGHYARNADGRLLRGIDAGKDQSYFLWAVPQDAIAHALFPLGGLHKDKTRALARAFDLPVAEKRDSQGVCFLGSISVEDFLAHELDAMPGRAIDAGGKEVGRHAGAILPTIGQRVALKGAPPGPWYVVRKDMAKNELTVSLDARTQHAAVTLGIEHANWFAGAPAGEGIEAQYRYHGPVIRGKLSAARDAFIPANPLAESIAPGQSLVLYRGDECLGGGIISGSGMTGDIIG